jgi:hypothetical protein
MICLNSIKWGPGERTLKLIDNSDLAISADLRGGDLKRSIKFDEGIM